MLRLELGITLLSLSSVLLDNGQVNRRERPLSIPITTPAAESVLRNAPTTGPAYGEGRTGGEPGIKTLNSPVISL